MNYLLNLLSLEFLYNISLLVAFGAEKLTIRFGLQVMVKKGPSSPPLFVPASPLPLLPYSGDYGYDLFVAVDANCVRYI